jgi:Protein of unknown function (DUF3313)
MSSGGRLETCGYYGALAGATCRGVYRHMNSTLRHLLIFPFLALASCAGQETTRTGFLSFGYDKLQPTKEHPEDLIYVSPAYVPANYTKVVIEPVAWWPAEGAPLRDPSVIKQLQDDFHKSLSKALTKKLAVVAAGATDSLADSSGMLRVRGAITSTRRANWYINAPLMLVGAPPVNAGGASVEIEVLDAGNGQPMVALVTFNNGMPWNVLGYYQQFGHARRAFELASELLVEHSCPNPR